MQVHVAFPLATQHIIALKGLLKGADPKKASREAFGFRRKQWIEENRAIFPVEMSVGKPVRFGPHIICKLRAKDLTVTVRRKAHYSHIEAMLRWVGETLPSINLCAVFLRRKTFDEIKGVQTLSDLERLIITSLKTRATLNFRLKW